MSVWFHPIPPSIHIHSHTHTPHTDSLSASNNSTQSNSSSTGETAQIRAPASLWRCSRIMYLLRDLHPTLLSALEGIVDQLVWFRENWYEELLRQLNEGLIVCQAAAFENRTDGMCKDCGGPVHTCVCTRKLTSVHLVELFLIKYFYPHVLVVLPHPS